MHSKLLDGSYILMDKKIIGEIELWGNRKLINLASISMGLTLNSEDVHYATRKASFLPIEFIQDPERPAYISAESYGAWILEVLNPAHLRIGMQRNAHAATIAAFEELSATQPLSWYQKRFIYAKMERAKRLLGQAT